MISIWEGNITKLWDAIQFCRIIDNMIFWAQNCLKPMVTKYLDQWRLRYCPGAPSIYCRLEKDTETAELVHRIQDRFSSLGISPNDDLASLVQRAVILQEVMRPTDEKQGLDQEMEDKNKTIPTSIPNRPRDTSKIVIPSDQEQSGQDMEKMMKHKAECAEDIQQQDYYFRSGKDGKRIIQSSDSHHSPLFQPPGFQAPLVQPKSSPKLEATVAAVSEKGNTSSTKEDQKVAEDPRGEHFTESNFSYSE
jgi:hypothetical protein